MKISLIITTKNEAKTLPQLLDSIIRQSLSPDELVCVDAHSSDATVEILKQFAQTSSFPVRIFKRNLNRSQGRNLAIQKATYPIIAVTDAGCILDKNWLKHLATPILRDQADSVAGFYLPITPTCFEKSVAAFVTVKPSQLDPQTFLPSSRSVAFTKKAWEKAGHYPEHLNYCEDLVFARSLKNSSRMLVRPNALVYWLQTTSWQEFFQQITHYAQGDVEARYTPHLIKIATIYLRYLIFIIFPIIYPLYLLLPILKHYTWIKHPLCLIFLPPLQVVSDFAVMYGSLRGLLAGFFLPRPKFHKLY